MSDPNIYADVSVRAHTLMVYLATEVPGDLGTIIRSMLGTDVDATAAASINPPAKPIWWATQLLALCCDAYGQPTDRAVPVGACLELFGIAAAALDAAQDGHEDLLSRYVAGTYIAHDSEVAGDQLPETANQVSLTHDALWDRRQAVVSNASVALIGLFWQALLEHGPLYDIEQETLLAIGRLLAARLVRICHGQHLDLTIGCDAQITLDEYEQIIVNKTGEIDGLACEVGALLAGAAHHRDLFRTMGLERAVSQQLYDDSVDLSEDLTGGGQVNHPVLYGLTVGSAAERDVILTLVDRARKGGASALEAVHQLSTLLRDLGAEHYTVACMLIHREKAIDALRALQLPAEADAWLRQWVMSVDPLHTSEPQRGARGNAA